MAPSSGTTVVSPKHGKVRKTKMISILSFSLFSPPTAVSFSLFEWGGDVGQRIGMEVDEGVKQLCVLDRYLRCMWWIFCFCMVEIGMEAETEKGGEKQWRLKVRGAGMVAEG
eukprot:Lithocolla_globosa_v1_NODE_4605_length_1402_cov_20.667409.p2 type:complete len:112 gc:universal NODE_4605_length_1402_cov_20.667409:998-663(-)